MKISWHTYEQLAAHSFGNHDLVNHAIAGKKIHSIYIFYTFFCEFTYTIQ